MAHADYDLLTYPSYDEPLLSAYGGRFQATYVVLHPFLRERRQVGAPIATRAGLEAPLDCVKHRWDVVATEANLLSYSEVNHGLLSVIHALKPEFRNEAAAAALQEFLERSDSIRMPTEGEFPEVLKADIIDTFRLVSQDRMVFVPEFPEMDPVQELELEDLSRSGRGFPYRGTLTDPDGTCLFTVDWDSFFTLLYGPRALVTRVVEDRVLEGFFVTDSTRHNWWQESIRFCDASAPDSSAGW